MPVIRSHEGLKWVEDPAPGPLLSLRVRMCRASLDERLAQGEDPNASPALAMRAAQICERNARIGVSRAISAVLRRAESRRPVLSAAIPLAREEVLNARAVFSDIHAVLSGPEDVHAAGVARLLALLRDGTGPLYQLSRRRGTLADELRAALHDLRLPTAPTFTASGASL